MDSETDHYLFKSQEKGFPAIIYLSFLMGLFLSIPFLILVGIIKNQMLFYAIFFYFIIGYFVYVIGEYFKSRKEDIRYFVFDILLVFLQLIFIYWAFYDENKFIIFITFSIVLLSMATYNFEVFSRKYESSQNKFDLYASKLAKFTDIAFTKLYNFLNRYTEFKFRRFTFLKQFELQNTIIWIFFVFLVIRVGVFIYQKFVSSIDVSQLDIGVVSVIFIFAPYYFLFALFNSEFFNGKQQVIYSVKNIIESKDTIEISKFFKILRSGVRRYNFRKTHPSKSIRAPEESKLIDACLDKLEYYILLSKIFGKGKEIDNLNRKIGELPENIFFKDLLRHVWEIDKSIEKTDVVNLCKFYGLTGIRRFKTSMDIIRDFIQQIFRVSIASFRFIMTYSPT